MCNNNNVCKENEEDLLNFKDVFTDRKLSKVGAQSLQQIPHE